MVNIHKKNMALKVAWIKRIIEGNENGVYPILVHYLKYEIGLLLKCNVSPALIVISVGKPMRQHSGRKYLNIGAITIM